MNCKTTDNLQEELMQTADLSKFLEENKGYFDTKSVSTLLNQMFERCEFSKATLAKESAVSEIYLHQIFSGHRNPSRVRLICLCFGMRASLEETQELLKHSGHAPLYSKNRRDAIIMYGLAQKISLFEINDKLFLENEETLF